MGAHTPCNCAVNDGHIVSCPLHAAAPALLRELERTRAELYRLAMKAPDLNPNVDYITGQADAAIRAAKGESNETK
jgi:hypothetical protein